MDEIAPLVSAERRVAREKAMRMKQFVASITTVGYAGLAGGLYEPILKHQPLRLEHVGATLLSILFLGLGIWLAPATELDDGRL